MSIRFIRKVVESLRRSFTPRPRTRRPVRWALLDRVFHFRRQLEELEPRTVPATIAWASATGGSWNVGSNWVGGVVPTASDDALIPDLTGVQTITVSATTAVRSITSNEVLAVTAGTFTVGSSGADQSTLLAGLNLSGGTFTGSGMITAQGTSTWSGGQLGSTSQSLQFINQGTLTFSGASSRNLQNATFTNLGTVNQTNGQLVINTSTFTAMNGSTYNLTGALTNPAITTSSGSFDNSGTFTANIAGTSGLGGTFNNLTNAKVDVQQGTFQLPGGGTHSGTLNIASGSTLELVGGTTTFNTGASVTGTGTLKLSGSVTANATMTVPNISTTGGITLSVSTGRTLTVSGTATFSGGTVTSSGTGSLVLSGTSTLSISTTFSGNVTNSGSFTVSAGQLSVNSPGVFTNNNGGTLTLGSTANPGVTGGGQLDNSGLVISSAAGNDQTVSVTTVNSTSTGEFRAGVSGRTLNVPASGTHSGKFTALSGATLNIQNGTMTLAGATLGEAAGGGTVQVNSGTYNVTSATTAAGGVSFVSGSAGVNISNGVTFTLSGSNTITGIGLNSGGVTAGTMKNTGSVSLTGTLSISKGTFQNSGTVTVTGSGGLSQSTPAVFQNDSGATLDLQANTTFGSGNLGSLTNAGTVQRSVGAGTATLSIPYSGAGAILGKTGTFAINTPANVTGTVTANSGGIVAFGNGFTHTFGTGAAFAGGGEVQFLNGTFNVTDNVTSSVNTSFASDFGTVNITSGKTLTLSGASNQWSAGTTIAGATVRNTGTLTVSGTGTRTLSGRLANAGVLDLSTAVTLPLGATGIVTNEAGGTMYLHAAATVSGSAGTDQLLNQGSFVVSGGNPTISSRLSNSGSLTVASGFTLTVSGVVAQMSGSTLTGGTWQVDSSGNLSITSGSNITTIGSGATVTLAGAFSKLTNLDTVQGTFNLGTAFTAAGNLTNAFGGTVQLTGSGALTISASKVFTNNFGGTVSLAGTGTVSGGGTLANSGLVRATAANDVTLGITNYSSTSSAFFRAASPGYTFSVPVTGTHVGTFAADVGSTLALTGGAGTMTWNGVSLGDSTGANIGTVKVEAGNYNVTLGSAAFDGVKFNSTSAVVSVSPGVTFSLIGSVNLAGATFSGSGNVSSFGPTTLTGNVAVTGGTFLNIGTLNQTGGQLTLSGGTFTNQSGSSYSITGASTATPINQSVSQFLNAGTLRVDLAGTNTLGPVANQTGGTVQVLQGTVVLGPGTPGNATSQGKYDIASGATIQLGGNPTFGTGASVVGAGYLSVVADLSVTADVSVSHLSLVGNSITVSSGKTLTLAQSSIWSGGGFVGSGTVLNASNMTVPVSGSLTLSANFTNASTGGLLLTGSATIEMGSTGRLTNTAGGTIRFYGGSTISGTAVTPQVVNDGGLIVQDGITGTVLAPLSNTGTVWAFTGATLNLTGAVSQYNGATNFLSGGAWRAYEGIINFPGGTNILAIDSGTTVEITGATGKIPAIANLENIQGALALAGGADVTFTPASSLGVNGSISVDGSGTVLRMGGGQSLAINGNGTLSLGGGTVDAAAGGLALSRSQLIGTGTIQGNVSTNAALISPGFSPGILTITGDLTLNSSSEVQIEVQGTNSSTPDFDRILVSGTASLSGTLTVTYLNGFVLSKSETPLGFLTYGSVTGDFTTKNLPDYSVTSKGASVYTFGGTAYVVSNTNDSSTGSLRKAIQDANANAGADTIVFAIPGSGIHTIQPNTPLPAITGTVNLDATTQSGYSGTPLVELRGDSAGANAVGFTITGSGVGIRGFVINRFSYYAIETFGSSGVFEGNYIGTNAAGTAASANLYGVVIRAGANDNRVGGATGDARNIISGNTHEGVWIESSNNQVAGNYIGTDFSGMAPLANAGTGVVLLAGATHNVIGTDGDGVDDGSEGNVISANGLDGIGIFDFGTSDNVVAGNFIGTTADGLSALGNQNSNILILNGASNNRIGTDADGTSDNFERNIIAASKSYWGVFLSDAGTSGNILAGNYIGTDVTGDAALGNALDGVAILGGASGNTIGGTRVAERNVLSGNTFFGAHLGGAGVTGNNILGNFIGTNHDGTAAIPNLYHGIVVDSGASFNTIGGTTAGSGNVISGNAVHNVVIVNPTTTGNRVVGNLLGTDVTGTVALGGYSGVAIWDGAHDNIIGGDDDDDGALDGVVASRNIISGNDHFGVWLTSFGAASHDNIVQGNYIGVAIDGMSQLANAENGVFIQLGSNANTIGGTTAGSGNVISGNTGSGVRLEGSGTSGNILASNLIGVAADGATALGNTENGIYVTGNSSGTVIGQPNAGRNIISGNGAVGIRVDNQGPTDTTTIAFNFIGVDKTGAVGLGNGSHGIYLDAAGIVDVTSNVVSGNTENGVRVYGGGNTVSILFNLIGSDYDGYTAIPNVNGVSIGGGVVGTLVRGNVLSGNSLSGIQITDAGTSGTIVTGNVIGLASDAYLALPNAGDGVRIENGADTTTIGGTVANDRNIISGNSGSGIHVSGSGTSGVVIRGNYIGTDQDGEAATGNGGYGVVVSNTSGTIIGGSVAVRRGT
ncbi:MAG: hypothetical protein U0791_13060 [Gemmataceae bacterium]